MAANYKIAHRGASGHAPENTLLAIEAAIRIGATAVEIDVHRCLTGEVVVIHDPSVDRTTSGKGDVAKTALTVLKELDAGQGQKIPTLREVLDLVNRRCPLFIDLKAPDVAMPTAELVTYYNKHKGWQHSEMIIISSYRQLLVQIHQKFPKIPLGVSIKEVPESLAACAEFTHSTYLLPAAECLNDALVEDARKRRVKIIAWTCNDAESIASARRFGVDGIMSDFPERL